MQPGMQQSGRPYVMFERRGIERRRPMDHATEPGMIYVVDVDFVKVTPQGSKDIFEKEAEDWFSQLQMKVNAGMEPMENQLHYTRLYEAWKKGVELPLDGTPVRAWPLATRAEQDRCIGIHLRTVEELANCNQECITRLGMGGQALRNRAVEWLKAKQDTGPLVLQLEGLKTVVGELTTRLTNVEAENRVLRDMKGINTAQQTAVQQAPVNPLMYQEPPEEVDPNLVSDLIDEGIAELAPV